jgi:PhoPQ-activated pathogenicity-related protein
VYELALVSQTWHDVKWEHAVQVFVPAGAKPQKTMLLWNQGGTPSAGSAVLGLALADKIKAPVAFLYGVPNQPIPSIGGPKKEDALIAETFLRYLKTKDPTWPLLFPMAKSVVSTMDALQAFAKETWQFEVTHFVVTGASKRGWTSWLTAASGDKRVKAIAPLVIDTLNMNAQMENQRKAFGTASEQIKDYTDNGLFGLSVTPGGRALLAMVDPYTYREKLTLPKMLIHGTNDPYWPQDAMNSYWDDLKGEKHVLYVPNAGHNLIEVSKDGKKEQIPTRAVNTLSAFARSQIYDKPLPTLTWKHTDGSQGPEVAVRSDVPFKNVRLWTTSSETRDFRKSRWESGPQVAGTPDGRAVLPATPAASGLTAFYAEADYEQDGVPFTLSTQIRILEAKK